MVLLDGLVERGLAQQQEAEANPHGQQPGHGEAGSAGRHTGGNRDRFTTPEERQEEVYCNQSLTLGPTCLLV